MAQVFSSILSPEGRAVVEAHELIEAPLVRRVEGATFIVVPTVPLVPVAPAKLIVGTRAATERVTFAVELPIPFVTVTL
jgi:hypothetical protein